MGMKDKKPVSSRALLQRINRALERRAKTEGGMWEKLIACRPGTRDYADLGAFYEVDYEKNAITGKYIDLEKFGRELEVLKPWERLA